MAACDLSISAFAGRKVRLYASQQLSPTSFVLVGGLRNTAINATNNDIDISNSGSNGYREMLNDRNMTAYDISGDGIFDSKTAGAQIIYDAFLSAENVEVKLESGHGDAFIFCARVSTYTRTGAYNDAETFSLALQSSGVVTYIPAP